MIDLRSDTVSKPTPEMLQAMATAEVGDDVYGEDPTINRLQEISADMLGKEAGLFVPSGTMGNLVSILATCQRGEEIILGDRSHVFLFEAGGTSALGGVVMSLKPNQDDGTIALEDIKDAVRSENIHFPRSKMIILENTHNRCGGTPISTDYIADVADIAREKNLKIHMDGARLFNAAEALGCSPAEVVKNVDSVTFCLSKGLCAPVGSIICGKKEFIDEALRIRKQLGGGMRQAGYLAAAGIIAVEKMTKRLDEDHRRAANLREGLLEIEGISLYLSPSVSTNMVFIELDKNIPMNTSSIVEKLAEKGVKIMATGSKKFRLVTHYWIDDLAVEKTIETFKEILV